MLCRPRALRLSVTLQARIDAESKNSASLVKHKKDLEQERDTKVSSSGYTRPRPRKRLGAGTPRFDQLGQRSDGCALAAGGKHEERR